VEDLIREAAQWLASARKTIALTGAGVSTESGIPDFRSAGGLWTRYDPAEYATMSAFRNDPAKVWGMLEELEDVLDADPNPGHLAFAQLEAGGALAGIVTQNVDGLHQAAGSRNVVEYHGSNRTYTCMRCQAHFTQEAVRSMPRAANSPLPLPETCREDPGVAGERPCVLKPDAVFFDEQIPSAAIQGTQALLDGADLILVAGTSGEVYPAAEIPFHVRQQGGRVIEINLEPAPRLQADLVLQGSFSKLASGLHAAWEKARN